MVWRSGVLSLLGVLGVNSVCRQLLKKQPRILMFHKIYPVNSPDNHGRHIDAKMFGELVTYIKSKYHLYKLKDLVQYRNEHGEFPDNAVVLTFDDGYKSFKDIALPILSSLNVPATVFLCPQLIDNSEIIWPDHLESAYEAGVTKINSRGELSAFIEKLKKLDVEERKKLVVEVLEKNATIDEINQNSLLMDWDDIRAISHSPLVEIGSHSLTHAILANESVEQAKEEIIGSKILIEKRIACEVTSFCYPNGQRGDFRDSEVKALEASGYQCAVTSEFGLPDSDSSAFMLPRFGGDFVSMKRARKYIDGVELIQRRLLSNG